MASRCAVPCLLSALLLGAGVTAGGCQEVLDVFNRGEEQARESEEHRRRFQEKQKAANDHLLERAAQHTERREAEANSWVEHAEGTPEAKLRALVDRRLECFTDKCKHEVLQEVRADSAKLLAGVPGLVSRQPQPVVVEVIRMAGLFKHQASVDAVARAAMVGSRTVRAEAVWALGEIGGERAVKSLSSLARLDNPPELVASICHALGQVGDPDGLEAMETLFGMGDAKARGECVRAAGRTRSERALPLLSRAIHDPDPMVLNDARTALEATPGRAARKLLKKLNRRAR